MWLSRFNIIMTGSDQMVWTLRVPNYDRLVSQLKSSWWWPSNTIIMITTKTTHLTGEFHMVAKTIHSFVHPSNLPLLILKFQYVMYELGQYSRDPESNLQKPADEWFLSKWSFEIVAIASYLSYCVYILEVAAIINLFMMIQFSKHAQWTSQNY